MRYRMVKWFGDNMVTKYTITIPNKKEKLWRVAGAKRTTAELVIRFMERKLKTDKMKHYSGTPLEVKTCVRIKDDDVYINETLNSCNAWEIMFAVVCFLEDYLKKGSLERLINKYGNH